MVAKAALMEGLLWFDDNPCRPLTEKVAEAAERYQERFGIRPKLCLVNPSELDGNSGAEKAERRIAGIKVQTSRSVLPHHLLVGIVASTEAAKR